MLGQQVLMVCAGYGKVGCVHCASACNFVASLYRDCVQKGPILAWVVLQLFRTCNSVSYLNGSLSFGACCYSRKVTVLQPNHSCPFPSSQKHNSSLCCPFPFAF